MGLKGIFIFNGDGGMSAEEIALGTPDISEAKSLEHHVDRCALRYKMFTKRLTVQGDDLNLIKNILFGLLGFEVVTNHQMQVFTAYIVDHFL